ncbi:class E sortase [Demequina iriomotensis]|uniref:class E sortase n=1 Tax=Demequina iriomotensis TaxID=1536641 RepID=UPI00078165F6|nr:class E sortase [Demequina iriomotensis]
MSASVEVPTQPDAPPPDPRRRAPGIGTRLVSLVGELCIIAGAVVGLYVVWQLFYTDVVADREQAEVVEDLDWAYTGAITAGDVAEDDGPQVIPAELHLSPDTAPVMDEPGFAETFATFYVPRWGTDYIKPISQGVTRREVLDVLGIGHYPGTGMPGAYGNFAISAHRTTYGKPFNRIAELQEGDALVVQTEEAWYVYRVTEHLIVDPSQVEVIAPNPYDPGAAPDGHYITLTSCHPMYSAAERYIVHGELEYWAPTGNGVPAEILEEIPQP